MLPDEREVGGLRCSEVLGRLSAWLDADLPPAEADQVRAHVTQCDRCARFGTGFARMVEALREAAEEPLPPEVAGRLATYLGAHLGRAGRDAD